MTKIEMIEILKAVRTIGGNSDADYTEDGHYVLARAIADSGSMGLVAKALTVAYNSGASGAAGRIEGVCAAIADRANDSADWEVSG